MADPQSKSVGGSDAVWSGAALVVAVAAIGAMVWRGEILATSAWAVVLQVLAGALMIWARLTFGFRSLHMGPEPTPGGLVTTGPFRFLRHPLYASMIWWVGAAAGSHRSALAIGLGALIIVCFWVRMLAEERQLLLAFPEAYPDYMRRTRRVVPFII